MRSSTVRKSKASCALNRLAVSPSICWTEARSGVTKSSIVRVLSADRFVTQRAVLTLPLSTPPDAHILRLFVARPRELETRILLGFRGAKAHLRKNGCFQGANPITGVLEEQIPVDWELRAVSPFNAPPIELGAPRDFAQGQQDTGWFEHDIRSPASEGLQIGRRSACGTFCRAGQISVRLLDCQRSARKARASRSPRLRQSTATPLMLLLAASLGCRRW